MIVTLLLFILILGTTVFVHELGHFLFAKKVGVHVYEFSLGFGPVLLKKIAKDKTQYSWRLVPLGGFVSLAGEEVEIDRKKHKGKNIQDKTLIQRFLVMFMGVGFNFIFAFLILFFIGLFFGAQDLTPIISEVTENYPAYNAGLEVGDKVLKINNKKVTYIDDISLYITLEIKNELTFEVKKENGNIEVYKVKPQKEINKDKTESYIIGISVSKKVEKGFLKSIKYAFLQECAFFKQMFVVLGNLITGKLSIKNLSGPVGIFGIVGDVKKQGLSSILYLLALLSINVGVINLLPFPAFDGGRILFLIIEKIKGSPINARVENIIHSIGFILLILLMIYVTINDILNLI